MNILAPLERKDIYQVSYLITLYFVLFYQRVATDEKDVEAMISVLKKSLVDPFSELTLLSISTDIAIDVSELILETYTILKR